MGGRMRIGLVLVFAMGVAWSQETPTEKPAAKAYRLIAAEKLESILKARDVKFEKTAGKDEGVFFYDYEGQGRKIRLHNYQGKDLWLESTFPVKMSLADVNRWNQRAKFTRAVRLKGDAGAIAVESQLDCVAGVTDAIVRQYLDRFESEVGEFAKVVEKFEKSVEKK